MGFTKSKTDSNLYYKVEDGNRVMLLLHVDDLFVTGMDGLIILIVMKWKIHQMDVKIDFLNGVVEEEVYVEQPLVFETHDKESQVCKLNKSCTISNRNPGHGTAELIAFQLVWA